VAATSIQRPVCQAAATCQATNDANLTDPGYEAPFFGIPSNLWFTPEGGDAAGFLPPYGPSTCGGYQYQQRDQEDLSFEARLTSPGDQALRWVTQPDVKALFEELREEEAEHVQMLSDIMAKLPPSAAMESEDLDHDPYRPARDREPY